MKGELRLEAKALTRSFGKGAAVGGLSLNIEAREIYGLVGPDGAGKTTTLRMLAGLLAPDAGEVRVLGADPFTAGTAVREGLGYMPQQYSLYGDLSVDENLAFFGELFCLDHEAFTERRARLLEITRLAAFGDRRADALSGGMYKKLALSCALLHQPKVLLLDEPTNGVDPVSRREFWDLLHDFVAEDMAIVLATPYMDEAARCDRTGLLFEGRLLEEGRPAELVRGLEHPVYRVEGDRARLAPVVERRPDILAFTPAGAHLRIVVERGHESEVLAALEVAGGHAVKATPNFEDLFLARSKRRPS